ncbi:MAG: hypothetical protein Q4D16_09530 [Eubacteriales bacterium]|nr:hypothetical protein [Eubacteriales bacterium]
MVSRMLVIRALDEKRMLEKRIHELIKTAGFVDIVCAGGDTVCRNHIDREEFCREADEKYQRILKLIKRYNNLDAAIAESNANTVIDTVYGKFTVAAAILLRNRLREDGCFREKADNFEVQLSERMQEEYRQCIEEMDKRNKELGQEAENMRLSILGQGNSLRQGSHPKQGNPLEVVDAYVQENMTELADPLDIRQKIQELKEKRELLLAELNVQIRISNATTYVTIQI